MCGIFAILSSPLEPPVLREQAVERSKTLRHRGPDWSGVCDATDDGGLHHCVAHERLAIVDPESGEQPLLSRDGVLALAVNGEIYNHDALKAEFAPSEFQTGSDCEVLLPLYQRHGPSMLHRLRGMWAFVLLNRKTGAFFVARDHVGICPLYMGWGRDGSLVFASEMKALAPLCVRFQIFPPGHYYNSADAAPTPVRWYRPAWALPDCARGTAPLDLVALRHGLEDAVGRHLMTDVPWGVLLSGGLDSSLMASIACRLHQRRRANNRAASSSATVFPAVHSFTVGLAGAPDLVAAQRVATFLHTVHHAYTFTVQQGLDAIDDIIYHLETYDITTIRASVPMYLMSRKIKSLGIKMVLSGEGADESFGGYLYFHKAPSATAFHRETVDKVMALHQYDCLRANKATAAWGVEARVPFLDADFLDMVMQMNTHDKLGANRIEKWPLRSAFYTPDTPYLPPEVLWRRKEQFSDGVGYSWVDGLRAYVDAKVSDAQLHHAPHLYPHNTPETKEGYLYRSIFEKHFPQQSAAETVPGGRTIACSTEAALAWDASFAGMADPSGRGLAQTMGAPPSDNRGEH